MLATKIPATVCSVLAVVAAGAVLCGCARSGPALLLDGEAALESGNHVSAVEKLKRATELLPNEPRAWNLLGVAYHTAGQPQQAAHAYRQALARDHSNVVAVAHFNLGCLLLEQGEAAAAVNELRSYTMVTNAAQAWVKLGQAQLRLRQFDPAERSLAMAMRVQRTNAEAYNNLGVLYARWNRSRDAAQYINGALQLDPKYPAALLNSAILAHQNTATRSLALQRYRDYLAVQPRSADWDRVHAVAQQLEAELSPRPAPAAPINSAPPPAAATKSNVPATTGATLAQTSAPPRQLATNASVPAVTRTTNAAPPVIPDVVSPPVVTRPAVTSTPVAVVPPPRPIAKNITPEPIAKPSVIAPPVAPPMTSVPVTVVSVAPPPSATVALPPPPDIPPGGKRSVAPPAETPVAAVESAPTDPVPAQQNEKRGLLNRLNPFKNKPDRPAAGERGTVVVVRRSEPASEPSISGARTFPRYTYRNPAKPAGGKRSDAERAFSAGARAHKAGNVGDARANYEQAVSADPSFLDAQYNYALLLQETGQLPASLARWETVLAIEPDSINARYNFALALKQANHIHEAAAELERVIEAKPAEARAHLTLANLYAQQLGDVPRARKHYMKVLDIDPRNSQAPSIRFWLAANP